QEPGARPGSGETPAARIAGAARIGDSPYRALRGELGVGKRKQMREALAGQSGDPEVHDCLHHRLAPNMENPCQRTTRFLTARIERPAQHAPAPPSPPPPPPPPHPYA